MKQLYRTGEISHWNTGKGLSKIHKDKISSSLMGHNFFTDDSNIKRNNTISLKISNGWVSPLKGTNISSEHKKKALIGLELANHNKQQQSLQHIVELCEANCYTIITHDYYYYTLQCNECSEQFTRTRQVFYPSKNHGMNICPSCNPPTFVSLAEVEVLKFIKSIINVEITSNDRKALNGKEIDIFIKQLNIGFEYCGLYWHSDIFHPSNHLVRKQTNALKENITIYTIFEDEWISKKEIVKSRIRNILNISKYRYYARKSTICTISSKESNAFLNCNHLQGEDKSPIRYGAFIDGTLTAVMTFKKSGFIKAKDNSFELNRFCVKKDVAFVGVASKLFKRFINDHNPPHVISYADYRWSNGDLYNALGFTFSHLSPPSPWYFINGEKRYHRSNFMRHLLNINDGDSTISEIKRLGYNRIYDCGHQLWEWFNSN